MDETRRKRLFLFVAVLVGGLAIVVLWLKRTQIRPPDRGRIIQTIPVARDGAVDRLLLVRQIRVETAKASFGFVLEFRAIPGGRIVWQRPFKHRVANVLFFNQRTPAMVSGDRLILKHEKGISALDLTTGKTRWSHLLQPHQQFDLYVQFQLHDKRVFVVLREGAKYRLFCLDRRTGRALWDFEFAKTPYPLRFIENRVYLFTFNSIHAIDLTSGKAQKLTEFALRPPIRTKEGLYFFPVGIKNPPLRRVSGNTVQPVMLEDKAVRVHVASKLIFALTDQHILLFPRADKESKRFLTAVPYKKGQTGFRIELPAGYYFRGYFLDWKRFKPSVSVFHYVQTRYLPLVLRKKGSDRRRQPQRLVLFDLKQRKIAWQSRPFQLPSVRFLSKHILYHKGRYLIRFPLKEFMQWRLLVLDGSSGKFTHILKVPAFAKLAPWQITARRLFLLENHGLAVYDLASRGTVFVDGRPPAISDATGEVSAIAGPLP